MRALEVDDVWLQLSGHFEQLRPGIFARRDNSTCLLDCLVPLSQHGVSYRTTLRQESSGWQVFELNQDITRVDDPEPSFEPERMWHIITIGSTEPLSVDTLFRRVSPPARPSRDFSGDDAESEAGLPGLPPELDGEALDDEDAQGPEPEDEGAGVVSPAELAAEPEPGHLVVEGVELHLGCTLATLRAACSVLGIGRSGGKATVLERIGNYLARQRLLERHAVQDDPVARAQLPIEQTPVVAPSEEELRRHMLSHIPYQPYCPHCVAYQARSDRHVRHRADTRTCSTLSFDFCYTERATGEAGSKLICLVLRDSHTGAVCAIPTPSKGGSVVSRFQVAEICKFLNFCGHEEVTLRSDPEPVCLALQQSVKDLRAKLRLATHLEQIETADHQANPTTARQCLQG